MFVCSMASNWESEWNVGIYCNRYGVYKSFDAILQSVGETVA